MTTPLEISPTTTAPNRRVQRAMDKLAAASAATDVDRAARAFKAAVFLKKVKPTADTPHEIAVAASANKIREQQIIAAANNLANYFRGGENQHLISALEKARTFAAANSLPAEVVAILNLETAN